MVIQTPPPFYEDEGLIVALDGSQGSGKTTSLVGLGYEDYLVSGKRIITNNDLNPEFVPAYTKLTLEYLISNMVASNELEDVILIMDETQKYCDSSSRTRESKDIMYLLEEARKRRMSVYLSSQRLNKIDLRIRDMLDLRGVPTTVHEKPCKKCKGAGIVIPKKSEEAELCDRCLGYKKVSMTTIAFKRYSRKSPIMIGGNLVDFHGRTQFDITFRANDYFHLFDTKQRMPLQAKKMRNLDLAEMV